MPTAITQFDEIYAVGDSLSDSGGIYQSEQRSAFVCSCRLGTTTGLQPIPISPPYAMRFSDGPVLP